MERIFKLLKKELNKNLNKQLVILCIGSKNIVGDSLGPHVGEMLINNNVNKNVVIRGSLKSPIHYLNIKEELEDLNKTYSDIYSIVIDSSLYTKSYTGEIIVVKNKVVLGSALDKREYIIGDIGIKGIVGIDYKNPLKNIRTLERVPKKLIEDMSLKISNELLECIN